MKYNEGLQEFQARKGYYARDDFDRDLTMLKEMSRDYSDFSYLHMTLLEYLNKIGEGISDIIEERNQTLEQFKRDFIRGLIYATSREMVEDTSYDIKSYEMPVSICMLVVSFGIIVSSFVPFFGIHMIKFGDASLNLIWATGGFLGAYIYSMYPLFLRYTRRDIPPRAFLYYALKVFLGIVIVMVFGNMYLENISSTHQFMIAAVLGSVPYLVLSRIRRVSLEKLGLRSEKNEIGNQDVSIITGVIEDYADRLHEEGVMNVQNLAYIDVDIMSKRTMFNKKMLFNWQDEAILRLLTGNIPNKPFLKEENNGDNDNSTLYDALEEVGINCISTLAIRLEYKRGPWKIDEEKSQFNEEYKFLSGSDATLNLLHIMNWKSGEEYVDFLEKICIQGKKMLGEITEPSISVFAY